MPNKSPTLLSSPNTIATTRPPINRIKPIPILREKLYAPSIVRPPEIATERFISITIQSSTKNSTGIKAA
jgi:hypothetical protein